MPPSPISISIVAALLAISIYVANGAPLPAPRVAVAVINEPDGPWGSMVFKQVSRNSPVQVQVLLDNIPAGVRTWGIYNEPVHYDDGKEDMRCSNATLKGQMRGGAMHLKHGRLSGCKFSTIGWDADLSLFNSDSIVQKSVALEHKICATIYNIEDGRSIIPGSIPCVERTWSDCTVSIGGGRCRKQECSGMQQLWDVAEGDYTTLAMGRNTPTCIRTAQETPVVEKDAAIDEDGTFECSLRTSSGLVLV